MSFRKIQTTNLVSAETAFTDPLVVLNKDGTVPTDIGFLGRTGAASYTGIVKDSQTGEFIVVDSITLTNQTVNDINALDASLTKGTVSVGTLKADTITSPSIPTDISDLTDTTNLLYTLDLSAVSQNIIPNADNVYDLGSPTKRWRDLYLGPGSLYINNKKVISDESNTMEFKTDVGQSLTVKTSGVGVLTLQSDTTVNFAANLQIASGKAISSNDGTVTFSDKIDLDNNQMVNVGAPTAGGHAATKSYVDTAINNIVNGAPAVLDTLNEIANAIGDDANFATTITNSLNTKAETTYVDAQVASAVLTASTDATTKANAAQAAAIATAATDATTKANTAQAAAEAASALDATTKANAAQAAAIATAATDATTKANTALVDAKAYTDSAIPTDLSSFANDSGYITTVTQSDVTAHQAALTITESQISDLANYVQYYEQSAAPTSADSGSIWKDTDTNIIYMAAVDNNVLSWFEI